MEPLYEGEPILAIAAVDERTAVEAIEKAAQLLDNGILGSQIARTFPPASGSNAEMMRVELFEDAEECRSALACATADPNLGNSDQ